MPRLRKSLALYLRHRRSDRKFAPHILKYFGNRDLKNVTRLRVFSYRRQRLAAGAAQTSVNKEVQMLRRVLGQYGLGLKIAPLRDDPRPPRKVTPDEWSKLAEKAKGSERWKRAYAVAMLAAASGLSRKDLRRLTWESVDPFADTIAGSPLTVEARDVLIEMERRRMYAPGRCRATDLLLNFRCWKDAWKAMMREAGLGGLTLNDVRAIQSHA